MKLFHGSNIEIHVPDLSRSKPYKDFGQGFYLSDNYLQAEEMAMHKVDQLRTGSKCISVFEFDEQHLISGELDIRIFDDYSEEERKQMYESVMKFFEKLYDIPQEEETEGLEELDTAAADEFQDFETESLDIEDLG